MQDLQPNMVDYEKTRQEFKLEVPEHFNFGFDVVDKWAQDRTKLALVIADEMGESTDRYTFWEMKNVSNKFANVLKRCGVKKGDRIFLMLGRVPEWYISLVAMFKLGAVAMPATVLCTRRDIEYRINRSKAVMVITDDEGLVKVEAVQERCPTLKTLVLVGGRRKGWLNFWEHVEEAPARLEKVSKTKSDDTLLLYFTSGTVSYPKMVLHTQASYAIGHTITAKFWQDLKPTDLHWTLTDTGWAKAAWGSLFGQWTLGATVFHHNSRGKFDAAKTLKILERYGITTFCAPPTGYRMMILEDLKKYDLSNLRHCMSAGEPLNPEVMKVWEDGTGLKIYDGYGQTETVNLVANYRCLPIRPGSMGKPTPGFDVQIVDDDGNVLGPNEEGYIGVRVKPERPVGLFKEYWQDPEEMSRVFSGDWYFTGDKAYKDEDGYFWFVGRADDVIISSGYRIGPFEVESALVEHPAVAESAVVASPDAVRGEIVKAFVVLKPGYSPSEELANQLQQHVREVTAPYKYPRVIDFVTDLPKTISGKIRRGELKKKEWAKELKRKPSYAYTGSEAKLVGATIGETLREMAEKHPDSEALVAPSWDVRLTYGQFLEVCAQAAKSFMELGVQKGDRVAIWATNHPEWVIAQFATAMIGAILVTVNPAYRTHELEYGLSNSKSQTLVLLEKFKTSDYVSMLYEVCPEAKKAKPGQIKSEKLPFLKNVIVLGNKAHPGMWTWKEFIKLSDSVSNEELGKREHTLDADEVINIQYTSGTTGLPKGASLTHHNILNNGFFIGEAMKFSNKDRLCIPVPFYHCFGMVLGNLACITHGSAMVIPGEYFDPLATLQTVEKEKCTAIHGVPTMFIAELEHPDFGKFDLSTLRTGIMAGSPCPIEVMKKVVTLMYAKEMTIAYGQTETSPVITQTPYNASIELRTSTVGPPLPHTEVKIVDPDTGVIVPMGEAGELCCRGYQVMRGYYDNPEATGKVIDQARWIHTGDLATMDENGYCKITGRLTDMIIRGGENIYPREIEEFLYTHPKVSDAQVIGVPSKKFGEEVAVWIKLKEKEKATPEEIQEFCRQQIAHYKVPKYIKFVDEFPMTVTGKIQKFKMRELSTKELGLDEEARGETA
jgi:fatty-acyl-CoA synthase